MQDIRIGCIGTGIIGKQHLQTYAKIKGVKVVAVADIDENASGPIAKELGITDVYRDFRKILERKDIDAVDVCLHNNLHAPVTIESLQAGKHVYCEKPMAGTYVDAKNMFDAAAKTGKKLHIQLSTLYNKEAKIARRLIQAGCLGKIYHARATGYRRRGRPYVDGYATPNFVQKDISAGGALYDCGVYNIAQVLHLLDCPKVERISGKVYQELPMDETRKKSSGYNVEEIGMGFVKMAGGLTLDIIESWAIEMNQFEGSCIVGNKGGVRIRPLSFYTHIADMPADVTLDVNGSDARWHALDPNEEYFDSSQQHWIGALQGIVPLLPTAKVALETMLISEGIYLSDKLGREVSADEVLSNSKSTAVKV